MKCPKCNSPAFQRKGFHFDHEYFCSKCDYIWEPKDEQNKTAYQIKCEYDGSVEELADLVEAIHGRFPLEDVISAIQTHIKFRLRNVHLSPELRRQMTKYLDGFGND